MKHLLRRITVGKTLLWLLVLLWMIIAIGPFYFMTTTSFKTQLELFARGVFALPESPHLSNYVKIISLGYFQYFLNSCIALVLSLFLILSVSSMSAYVFSRMQIRINRYLFAVIVACMAIPIHVTLIPIFIMSKNIGLYDSIFALIGPYVAFSLPISVFLLTGFMEAIPVELEQSARIDGCNTVGVFLKIVLPLTTSGLATVVVLNAVRIWNEFIFAMTLTETAVHRTLPLAVWDFQGQYASDMSKTMTILTLTSLPMIITFAIGQNRIISGIMAGAIKG